MISRHVLIEIVLHFLVKNDRIRYLVGGTWLLVMSMILFAQDSAADKLDLNSASRRQLAALELSDRQIEDILEWREYIGLFQSIFDLRKIKSIDYDTFLMLKEEVVLSPTFLEESQQRIEDNYYKIERWISDDGASENFVSLWIDKMSDPDDVNRIDFFELINLSGVSPVDAVAVVERQAEGAIRSRRDLRNTENLSYYGFSNLEDFIRYDAPTDRHKFSGSFSSVIKNITLSQTPSDDPSSFSEFKARNYPLDSYYQLRFGWGRRYKFGLSYLQNLGQPTFYSTHIDAALKFKLFNEKHKYPLRWDIPRIKFYGEFNQFQLGKLSFNKIVLGDYTASFGQGVVFEATDFFLPRKTGFGWRKRFNGIQGNSSRTTQYNLRGAATEMQFGNLIGTAFYSAEDRDAVVNNDGSFTTLITTYPRLKYGLYDSLRQSLTNAVKEVLLGGNFKYLLAPGTYIGATIYQSAYDRELDPQIMNTMLNASGKGKYLTQIGNSADSEIEASYSNSSNWNLWAKSRAMRRVYGLEFMSVFKNVALQGEYAQLDRDLDLIQRSDDPHALVVSGYVQFDNFNFLLLYRDYELGFDNPYQRSFSNYQRFKGTIYEDVFYLQDPILAYLHSGTAQPQAERGIYYSTRYQIHRTLILTTEHDIWRRVADNAQYNRLVLRAEYRPIFNYRFRIRQKWQHRDKTNTYTPVFYQANETRMEAILRMSRYNELRVLYSLGYTEFTPRSRLVINAQTGEDSKVGNAGLPSSALGVTITHNVNKRLKVLGSLLTYEGFLWNFEDTDFRVFNTETRALHGWITLFSRLSRDLSIRFKYSFDLHQPMTNIVAGYVDLGLDDSNPLVEEIFTETFYSDFRIQFDYRF